MIKLARRLLLKMALTPSNPSVDHSRFFWRYFFMANIGYITINGSTQGAITKDASTADSIGNTWQEGHEGESIVY
ncbi:MAG: hypothetical protein KGI75_04285, partial [Rhizobiaceae bacterium]|nr:hypothetical protein [Rhizobiaceae bacterium]